MKKEDIKMRIPIGFVVPIHEFEEGNKEGLPYIKQKTVLIKIKETDNLAEYPEIPNGWVEMKGQVIDDEESPLHGVQLDDYRGDMIWSIANIDLIGDST